MIFMNNLFDNYDNRRRTEDRWAKLGSARNLQARFKFKIPLLEITTLINYANFGIMIIISIYKLLHSIIIIIIIIPTS